LPALFAGAGPELRTGAVLGRGLMLLGLAAWSGTLGRRARRRYWREAHARIAVAFLVWAVSRALPAAAGSGPLAALADGVAFLVLAAAALNGSAAGDEARPETPLVAAPFWTPAAIGALAFIPVFEAIAGGASGVAGLDDARRLLTRVTLVAGGLALMLYEILT